MKNHINKLFIFSVLSFALSGISLTSSAQYGRFDSISVNVSTSGTFLQKALLYKPVDLATAPAAKRWPLIVNLSGIGENNGTLSANLSNGLPNKINSGQLPTLTYGGYTTQAFVLSIVSSGWALNSNQLSPAISYFCSRYRVDSSRIYFTGYSAGGEVLGYPGGKLNSDTTWDRFISAIFARSPHNGSMVLDSSYRIGQKWKIPTALIVGAVNDGGTENAFRQFSIDLQNRLDDYYTNSFYQAIPGWGHDNFARTYDTAQRYSILGNRNFYEWLAQYTNNKATSYNGEVNPYAPPVSVDNYTCNTPFKLVVLGSSTAQGIGALPIDSSWVAKFTRYITGRNGASTVINLGTGGYNSFQVLRPTGYSPGGGRPDPDPEKNITKAISLHPDAIIINLASNDASIGFPLSEQQANFNEAKRLADSARIPLWVTTTQPRDFPSQSQRDLLINMKDWINSTYGAKAIDFWSAVSNPDGTINSYYAYGDGTHVNNYGHHLFYTRVVGEKVLDSLCARAAVVANIPPVANAGTPVSILWPLNITTLDGSASSDADGTIVNYKWSKVSGPSSFTLSSLTSVITGLINLVQGSYVFRLTVTDNSGDTASADVTVNVNVAPNQSPVANAGSGATITLPANTATLNGTASSDPDGTIASYAWSKLSGPTNYTFANAGAATTTVSGLTQGSYVFRLTVTDNGGATATADVTIIVNAAANQTPVANAGSGATITLPANTATLNGTGSSDPDGTIASYAWSKLSGPTNYTFANAGAATTTVSGLTQGSYVFRLTVTDNGGATATADVTIIVNAAANQTPVANAGSGATITLPANTATLNGTASSDPDGTIASYAWSKLSGPTNYTFANAGAATTTVSGLTQGTYIFRLTVTDNSGATATADVTIVVNAAANQAPVANAGSITTITLPVNVTTLSGIGSNDPDGTIVSYAWSKLSGPATFTLANANLVTTALTGLVQGTYVFRLTVTDNAGATGTADVTIVVNASTGTTPPTANAGIDQTINLPQNFCTLYGGAPNFSRPSANGGRIVQWNWSQVSGPNTAVMSRYSTSQTNITSIDSVVFVKGMAEGTYQFKLSIVDMSGGTAEDIVQVTIKKCNYNSSPKSITFTTGVYLPINAGAARNILPGDTIKLDGNLLKETDQIALGGMNGCEGQPIIIMPINKKVNLYALHLGNTGFGPGYNRVSYVHVKGNAIAGEKYGIRTKQVAAYTVDHIEISNVEIINSFQSAIHMGGYEQGSNPDPARMFPAFYQRGIYIHDNYIDTTFQEGMYIGSSSFGSNGWNYPNPFFARGDSVYIYNNIVKNTGRDGIQVGSVGYVKIFNNYVENTGNNNEYGQKSAINFGTGCYGEVSANYMKKSGGTASFVNGYDSIKYINNFLDSCSFRDTDPSVYPSVIYTDGSPHDPETVKPQRLVISGNYIRNPFNTVRGIFSNDYNNLCDPTRIDSNKLWLPNYTGSTWENTFVVYSSNPGSTAVGNTRVSAIPFPALPMPPVCGPTLKDPRGTTCGIVNQAPIAHAGADITLTLPTNSTTLNGSASSDPDGTIVSYNWTRVSGPATFTMASPGSVSTALTGLVEGVYVFSLMVTDNDGGVGTANVTVTVNAPANQLPVANAGNDIDLTLPANSTTLNGTASYDPDGTITTYAWSRISGPATFTIANPSASSTALTGLVQGSYAFRLLVTDNRGGTAADTIAVTVNPANNQPPVADAGAAITITLPTDNTTLNGTASSDPDGSIDTYTWSKISGPATFTIANASASVTALNDLVAGVYVFRLSVTDNSGATATDDITVTVNPAANQPPVADAGADITLTLPANSTTLNGSASSDPDGTIATYAWSRISGPTTFTLANANAATTGLSGLVQGTYVFKLTVTDNNGASATANVAVIVNNPGNQAPVANAGQDITLTLPVNSTPIDGSSSSDADGTIATYRWSWVSGPAAYTIVNANVASTSLNGLVEGVYVFRLTVTDNNGATATNNLTVTVNPAVNQPPVARAGQDITITLPVNSTTLNGSASSDADGTILGYNWTKVSGPGVFTINNAHSSTTGLSGLVQGTYVFTLTVTDNNGATDTDDITVTVNAPANQSPVANAGTDITLTLPANSTTLNGALSNDPDGTIVNYSWSRVSGPLLYNITNPAASITTLTGLLQGTYVFALTVTDNNGASSTDNVTVTVNAPNNQAPEANAGTDINITLPINSTTLVGSSSFDPDGTIVSFAWNKVSGPASFTIANPAAAVTPLTGLAQGTYVFSLTVTDNQGAITTDNVTVTVNAAVNQPPVANAGADINITLPVNSTTLNGGASSDADGSIVSFAWSKVSGPSTFTIANPAASSTALTGLVQGTYVFSLTVTDNQGATATDNVIVTVNTANNQAPVANAGSIINLTLPDNSTTLIGSLSYDPDGNIAAYQWAKLSGPAAFNIAAPTSAVTDLTGLAQGTYVFGLTVTDNRGATATANVTVVVHPGAGNQPPVAKAGPQQTIPLNSNVIVLNGGASYDPDGTIVSYQWQQIRGPQNTTLISATGVSKTITDIVAGTYVFRLTVTDNGNAASSDTVTISVVDNYKRDVNPTLYPNPARDVVNIRLVNDLSGYYLINIYDVNGRAVMPVVKFEKTIGAYTKTVNVNGLMAGTYIAEIIGLVEGKKISMKFVKQ